MKILIWLLIFSNISFADEFKFHAGDKVKLKDPFYKNCYTLVKSYDPKWKKYNISYFVDSILNCPNTTIILEKFEYFEDELELVK